MPVGDGVADSRQPPGHAALDRDVGEPQSAAGSAGRVGVGGEQRRRYTAREMDLLPDMCVDDPCDPAGRAQLDYPVVAVWYLVGEVHGDRPAVGAQAVHGGRPGGRGVDHDQVAGPQEPRDVPEGGVLDRPARLGHQQSHLVPGQPALLGWLGGGELWRQDESGARVHRVALSRSVARYRPLSGRSASRRSRAGTTAAGSARSEMSSPGKAAWCIAVRMSPGSKA